MIIREQSKTKRVNNMLNARTGLAGTEVVASDEENLNCKYWKNF
jgi:hypothetical protein